jgi:GNAT superfamily N-acetyltransferase
VSPILHLWRTLEARPELPKLPGVSLRTYQGPEDIEVWLELRHRAFAREKLGVRKWDHSDFESEFLAKSWWSPERMWFAEVSPGLLAGVPTPVGSVALAARGVGPNAQPVVHWLAVLSGWRRQGIGRILMAALETYCWDTGRHRIGLETHTGWQAAASFYQALGYQPDAVS